MPYYAGFTFATAFVALLTFATKAHASDSGQEAKFGLLGDAPPHLVKLPPRPSLIVELGMGMGVAPSYEGSSEFSLKYEPIINPIFIEIPGLFKRDRNEKRAPFSIGPSVGVINERISADHELLAGLDDIATTYSLGIRLGYDIPISEGVSAELYGALRYAFGGAEGLLGEVGMNITARLTPELTITGGPVASFASDNYMKTYFGVTSAESANTGGRLETFDPSGGLKSVGAHLSIRYEFVPDYIVSLNASYSQFVGDAVNSPIVTSGGSDQQFVVTMGLSRRFSFEF